MNFTRYLDLSAFCFLLVFNMARLASTMFSYGDTVTGPGLAVEAIRTCTSRA